MPIDKGLGHRHSNFDQDLVSDRVLFGSDSVIDLLHKYQCLATLPDATGGMSAVHDGDGAERPYFRCHVLRLLDDANRPRDDSEAWVRWISNPGGRGEARSHTCNHGTEAVVHYLPDAQQPSGKRPGLCKAMNKAYHAAMTGRRQTLWHRYAEYMSLMPVNVGRVLILRGVSGASSAVEEVQGCALRSAARNSVMEHVNRLLLHYEKSHRSGKALAPYMSPDV